MAHLSFKAYLCFSLLHSDIKYILLTYLTCSVSICSAESCTDKKEEIAWGVQTSARLVNLSFFLKSWCVCGTHFSFTTVASECVCSPCSSVSISGTPALWPPCSRSDWEASSGEWDQWRSPSLWVYSPFNSFYVKVQSVIFGLIYDCYFG